MKRGFDTDTPLSDRVIAQAIADGYSAAGRYLRNVTTAEIVRIRAALGLWLIDETAGNWTYFSGGYAAGMQRGHAARLTAQALSYPLGAYIASAVDFDATPAQVSVIDRFLAGYTDGLGSYRLLVYGSGLVESSSLPPGAKAYLACASGWSGTRGYDVSKAALVQHLPANRWGIAIDPVDINDDAVVWWPAGAPASPVVPVSVMPNLKAAQAELQAKGLYDGALDGVWGSRTESAFVRFYSGGAP